MPEFDCDVAIVGYGPVGQVLASLLGARGHRVEIFERQLEPYRLPRAVHIDHEAARILQATGIGPQLGGISEPTLAFELRSACGDTLARFDHAGIGTSGWPKSSAVAQPDLEALLDARARSLPSVSVHRGLAAETLAQDAEAVTLGVRGDSKSRTVRTRYVIGADGAASFVRSALATHVTDLDFEFDRLVVDVRVAPGVVPADAYTVCDPGRTVTVVSGGPGRRRWEFRRLPEESEAEITSEGSVWRLLETWGVTPENAVIERRALYAFRSLFADCWRDRRVLLAGDAAHLMPTYGGQGLCSGLRDAANLAWKLDFVLLGKAAHTLLDTYTSERLPLFRQLLERSIAIGRQATMAGPPPILGPAPARTGPPRPPKLGPGLAYAHDPLAGELFIQGRVAMEGRIGLLDDLAGNRLLLISTSDPAGGPGLDDLDGRALMVGRDFHDIDGTYARWFAENRRTMALVRPDFYLFGSSDRIEDAAPMIAALRRQLG